MPIAAANPQDPQESQSSEESPSTRGALASADSDTTAGSVLETANPEITEDALLGQRVRLRQPRRGQLRAGLDAVLLAAAVQARPGQRILEAGCGSGAVFLCLAARIGPLQIRAVERDAAMAALARHNVADNSALLPLGAEIITGDIADRSLSLGEHAADHAMANPPYWPGGTPPPAAGRAAATHLQAAAPLSAWAMFLASGVKHGGSVTMILPAAMLPQGLEAYGAAGLGACRIIPLWPRQGADAKRVLLSGRRGHRGAAVLDAGLVLHEADGRFTAMAEAILRDAAPLRSGG